MDTNMKENGESGQPTSCPPNAGGPEAAERLRICPKTVLGSLRHLRIDTARIIPIDIKAPQKGGSSEVETAILAPVKSSNSTKSDEVEYVAVKKLRFDAENDDGRGLGAFTHEVNLLSELSHENIVRIIGFVEDVESGIAWMVFSWERNGSLREFVRSENWELPERISLIKDVAVGLSYLHSRNPPICHGDLKSLNILVNSEYRAIITDFGSARRIASQFERTVGSVDIAQTPEHQYQQKPPVRAPGMESLKAELGSSGQFITMTGPAWTVRWAAPELLGGHLPGLASDIWALGWICWEAVTGNFPFDKENDVAVILRIVTGNLPAMKKNDQLRQLGGICSLMEDCWRLDPSKRPTAVTCLQVLYLMHWAQPSSREGDKTRSSGLLYALGWMKLQNDAYRKARKYLQQALEGFRSIGDEWGEGNALMALGHTYAMQSDASQAEELYLQSRDTFSRIGDRWGFANSVFSLGEVYRSRQEYSRAEESYIQARSISSQIGNSLGIANSVIALGDLYSSRCEYVKAEESYIQARDLYSQIGEKMGFAKSVRNLGYLYFIRAEYSKAEESYIQARDIFSQLGSLRGLAKSINHLGVLYRIQGKYPEAEKLHRQASNIFSQIGVQSGFARSLQCLGDLYQQRGFCSRAEESYIRARNVFSQIKNYSGLARSAKGLGHVYLARREYARAEESYLEARRLYQGAGNTLPLAQTLWSLGKLHYKQAHYHDARRLICEASSICSELGLEEHVAEYEELLREIPPLTGWQPFPRLEYFFLLIWFLRWALW